MTYKSYSEEEVDYVIDRLDLGFIRNRIKQSPDGINWMMGSFAGAAALIQFKVHKLTQKILKGKS